MPVSYRRHTRLASDGRCDGQRASKFLAFNAWSETESLQRACGRRIHASWSILAPSEKPIHLWCRARSLSLQDRDDLRLDWLPGDFDVFIRNVNVNFGSNAKLSFEIDSGLD